MDKDISHITLGIRHRRSFGLIDKAGEIMDHALYDESSPFNTSTFPNYLETNRGGKMIANEETGESFAADSDSVVLRLSVNDFEKTYLALKNVYLPYIKKVFDIFNIENINRIGIVFEHDLKNLSNLDKVISSFTHGEVDNPSVFSIRFVKKYPSLEAQIKKDIIDYYNAIFSFETQDNTLLAKLDYQAYFDPEYASLNDVKFDDFFDRAEKYLHSKFHTLLTHEKKL